MRPRTGDTAAVDTAPPPHTGLDADGDGFYDVLTEGRDCDDSDPAVHPDAWEIIGDGVDSDCDGGLNTAWMRGRRGFRWTEPRAPVAVIGPRHIFAAALAEGLEGLGEGGTLAVALPIDGDHPERPLPEPILLASSEGEGAGLDLQVAGGALLGLIGIRDGEGLALEGSRWVAESGERVSGLSARFPGTADFVDADLAGQGPDRVMVGCTANALFVMTGSLPDEGEGEPTLVGSVPGLGFQSCFAEVVSGTPYATVCGALGCESFAADLEHGVLAPRPRWADRAFTAVDAPGKWVTGLEGNGRVALFYQGEEQLPPAALFGETASSASASREDGVAVVAVAVPAVGGGSDLVIIVTTPEGEELSFTQASGLGEVEVDIAMYEDGLLVAAVIDNEGARSLRWMLYRL